MTKLRIIVFGATVGVAMVIPCLSSAASAASASAVASAGTAAASASASASAVASAGTSPAAVVLLPQDSPIACSGSNVGFGTADASNFLGDIISAAFNVARVAVDAAEGIALAAVGAAQTPGVGC
jgi:hypothetical protein